MEQQPIFQMIKIESEYILCTDKRLVTVNTILIGR